MHKIIVLFFFSFLSCIMYSQDTLTNSDTLSGTIKIEKKYNQADFFPRINGKFDGPISPIELCGEEGILTRVGITVIAFEIHTFEGNKEVVYKVEGSHIPEKYCETIKKLPNGELFYIRNIKAKGREGEDLLLNPMRFTISY